MTPANDNTPARTRQLPIIGRIGDTTRRPHWATVVSLRHYPADAILGSPRWPADVVPFPSDHREA